MRRVGKTSPSTNACLYELIDEWLHRLLPPPFCSLIATEDRHGFKTCAEATLEEVVLPSIRDKDWVIFCVANVAGGQWAGQWCGQGLVTRGRPEPAGRQASRKEDRESLKWWMEMLCAVCPNRFVLTINILTTD